MPPCRHARAGGLLHARGSLPPQGWSPQGLEECPEDRAVRDDPRLDHDAGGTFLSRQFGHQSSETLRETLKTLRMRELRILCRIKKAMDAEEIAGTPTGKMNGQGKELLHPAMLLIGAQQTKKADGNDATSLSTASETQEMHYLRLDAAHSMVLEQIRRVSDSLARMEGEGGEESRNGVAIVLDLGGGRRHEGDGN